MSDPGYTKTACSHCGVELEFPTGSAGRQITCPHCNTLTILTAAGSRAVTPRPSHRGLIIAGAVLFCVALAARIYFFGLRPAPAPEPAVAAAEPSAPIVPAHPAPPPAPAAPVKVAAPAPAPAPADAALREISGQLFYVLTDGTTAKLPATDILVMDATDARSLYGERWATAKSNLARLASIRAGFDAQLESCSEQLHATQDKLDKLGKLMDLTDQNIRLTRQNIQAAGLSESQPANDPKGDIAQLLTLLAKQKRNTALQAQLSGRVQAIGEQMRAATRENQAAGEELPRWHSPRIFFEEPLPPVLGKAATDADGRFTLKVPRKGEYWIGALVSGGTNDCGWLLPLPPATTNAITLDNNNTLYLP
jgi:DNA-directed RNA polymerase subunit RPC12/RpoP